MMKNFNRNPEGFNQWKLRTNEEIQKVINSYPPNDDSLIKINKIIESYV